MANELWDAWGTAPQQAPLQPQQPTPVAQSPNSVWDAWNEGSSSPAPVTPTTGSQVLERLPQAPSAPPQENTQTSTPDYPISCYNAEGGIYPIDTTALKQAAQQHQQQQNAVDKQTAQALGVNQDQINPQSDQLTTWQRFNMGLAPDFDVRRTTFLQYYPKGEFKEVKENINGKPEVSEVFRTDENSPYVRLRPTAQQSLIAFENAITNNDPPGKQIGDFITFMVNAAADNSRDALINLALLTAKNPKSIMGFIRQAPSMVTKGAITGGSIGAYESAMGRSGVKGASELPEEMAQQGAIDGLEAMGWLAGLHGLSWAGGKAYRMLNGEGVFTLNDAAQSAMEAKNRLQEYLKNVLNAPQKVVDSLNYIPSQILKNVPIIGNLARQTRSLLGQIGEYEANQSQAASHLVTRMVNPDEFSNAPNRALSANNALSNEAKNNAALAGAPNTGTSFASAGENYAKDLGDYADRSKLKVDQLYSKARGIQEPIFDAKPAVDAALEAEAGVKQPYVSFPAGTCEVGQISKPGPELQRIIDNIKNWHHSYPQPYVETLSNGKQVAVSAMDQIKDLRTQAWELTQPGLAGERRENQALAMKVFKGLDNMLENVKNTDPQFLQAWRDASTAARQRFQTLEDPLVRRGNRQYLDEILTTPESSLQTLTANSGRQVTALDRLKEIMQPENYEQILDAKRTQLLNSDPDTFVKTMQGFENNADGKELAKRLFPDAATQKAYSDLATNLSRVKGVNVAGKVEANWNENHETEYAASIKFVKDLLDTGGDTAIRNMQTLENMVHADPNSRFGAMLRSGVIQSLIDDNLRQFQNVRGISSKGLDEGLIKTNNFTLDRFLTDTDKQILQDVNTYLQWISNPKDLGSSLVGAEKSSAIAHLRSEALLTLLEHGWISYRLTSPQGMRFLYGTGDIEALKQLQQFSQGLHGPLPEPVWNAVRRLTILAGPRTKSYQNVEDLNNAAKRKQGNK